MAQTEATLERVRVDGPVKNTLHNLIQTLSIKLDSAARYGLYTEDARIDGYQPACATPSPISSARPARACSPGRW